MRKEIRSDFTRCASYFKRRFNCQLPCALICLILLSCTCMASAQETSEKDATAEASRASPTASSPSNEQLEKEYANEEFAKEVEPGVLVIGKTHRFAEVGNCNSFAVSPDGKTLICSGSKVKFFDLEENVVTDEIGESGESYQQVEFSPDGRYILGATYSQGESMVRVWDAIDLSVVSAVPCKAGVGDEDGLANFYVQKLYVSPDSSYYCAATYNSAIVRDLRTGELVQTFTGLQYIQGAAFSIDETQLYLPLGGRVQAFDIDSGEQIPAKESKLGMVAQTLDVNLSRGLLAASSGRTVRIKDLEGGQPDRTLNLPAKCYGQSVVFSDDGSMVAFGVWQQGGEGGFGIVVLDADTGKVVKEVDAVGSNVGRIRFSTDGEKIFYAGSGVFGINELLVHGEDEVADVEFPKSPSIANAIHPDKTSFLSCSSAGEMNVFDLKSGEILNSFRHNSPRNLTLSPDGSQVIVDSSMGVANFSVYGYESGKKLQDVSIKSIKGGLVSGLRNFMTTGSPSKGFQRAYPISVSLSPDETHYKALVLDMRYVASGGTFMATETEQIFKLKYMRIDAESGNATHSKSFKLEDFGYRQNQWVQFGSVSPTSSRFFVWEQSRIVCADGETGEIAFELDVSVPASRTGLKYSPDGKFIAAANGKSVDVWEAETGELLKELPAEANQSLFGFSGDSKRIAVCGRDEQSRVRVYDTKSWESVFERAATQGNRSRVSLSTDGQLAVFGLADCRLEVWDLAKLK